MDQEFQTSFQTILSHFLKRLRKEKGFTQSQMSQVLGISQSRLSEIEQGKGSIAAEQLLFLLKEFNLRLDDFWSKPPQNISAQLENSLHRLGAYYLVPNPSLVPSDRLSEVHDVLRETLIGVPSKNHILALAPVIVRQIKLINFDTLCMKLYDLGIDARVWWIVEGTLWAVRQRLKWVLPLDIQDFYQLAVEILSRKTKPANYFFNVRKGYPQDVFDSDILSAKDFEEVRKKRDELATRWRLITRIRVENLAGALEKNEKT